ncbi:hypothetical protein F2Q70_00044366 [Brassica cretica]|uniref:Protein kinase domain-containing protein n=1 Tax=Brassica cretica TaxID=69181 RepID=A0A8S9KDK4_BRACR|nr:hypothetical protein F2Q70_00044366 [Brassica cretica]
MAHKQDLPWPAVSFFFFFLSKPDKNECTEKDLYCGEDATCVNLQGSYKCVYRNYRLAIGICASFGSLIFIGGICGLYKFITKQRRLNQKKKFFKRNGGLLLQQQLTSTQGSNEKTRVFSSRELENATENFGLTRILGQGGQGTVYKGMLVDGRIVAVKKSKVVDEDKLEEFINEVVILSQINHRNIVKLLGCCLETDVPILVYEFIPNGNLFEHLHEDESDNNTLTTWEVRLRIAIDIAGALSYLHSAASSPIYHRDIKSTNIMLDEKYRAKVSDFGTSRTVTVDHTHLTTVVSGTVGYVDPEYFQSSQFTDKSDVYSFGVVLVELITGEKSVSFLRSQENRTLATYFLRAVKENRLFDIIDARIRDGCKLSQVNATANLARKCLNLKGRKRPSMRETSMELEKIRSSSVDMKLHEHGSENKEDNKKGVVDANIGVQSWNNNTVTAPTSQYDVGTCFLSMSDTEPLFPYQAGSNHTSPSAAPAHAPLAPAAASAPAPPGPPAVMSVAELVQQPGRDHLPFNRSGNGISAWINQMMYSALDRGHPTFTHFPTDKQVLWFRQFAQEFNWNSDETLFIYHHFVHKVMDNYGKQIHEWKKKWEINKAEENDGEPVDDLALMRRAYTNKKTGQIDDGLVRDVVDLVQTQVVDEVSQLQTEDDASTASTNLSRFRINEIVESSVPKKKGRLVGLGRRSRSAAPSSAPPPYVDPEVLTAQLKDKDDRISALETQMAAQQAGYETHKRLNEQIMEMMKRMYANEVFPNIQDP